MAAVESAAVYLSYRLLLPTGIKDYRLKAGVHSKKLNQWIEQAVDTKKERMWQSIEGWSKHQDSLAGRNCLDGCLKLLPNLSRNTSLSKLSGQCGCVRRFYVWSFYTLVCFSSQLMRFLVFSRKNYLLCYPLVMEVGSFWRIFWRMKKRNRTWTILVGVDCFNLETGSCTHDGNAFKLRMELYALVTFCHIYNISR